VDLAGQLARIDIDRYRALADPRYLGRAQATLARWWKIADPPPDVRLLRGIINTAVRDLAAARSDLDTLVALRPTDEAHAARATVARMTADYAAARESCAAISEPLAQAICEAPIEGIHGKADAAHAKLAELLPKTAGTPALRAQAMLALAELAVQKGDTDAAIHHVTDALGLDEQNIAGRDLWFDILYANGRAADAAKVLAHRETVDSHLARLAIAEHKLDSTEKTRLVGLMRDRTENARLRGEKYGLREEVRFMLVVEAAPQRAVELAAANWKLEKELVDARLLAEAAAAANDRAAAEPVIEWAKATGVRDAWLEKSLAALGVK
jgi:hypothetical protein